MNTLSSRLIGGAAVLATGWVLAAGSHLYWTGGAAPATCFAAIAVMLAAWLARWIIARRLAGTSSSEASLAALTKAILLCALLLGAALSMRIEGLRDHLDFDARSVGVFSGIMVLAVANVIPKQASSGLGLRLLRTAGWSLSIGGIAYALVWLLVPLAHASRSALLVLLAALAFATGRIGWLLWRQRRERTMPPA